MWFPSWVTVGINYKNLSHYLDIIVTIDRNSLNVLAFWGCIPSSVWYFYFHISELLQGCKSSMHVLFCTVEVDSLLQDGFWWFYSNRDCFWWFYSNRDGFWWFYSNRACFWWFYSNRDCFDGFIVTEIIFDGFIVTEIVFDGFIVTEIVLMVL